MRENTEQKNSVFGHFSRSVVTELFCIFLSSYIVYMLWFVKLCKSFVDKKKTQSIILMAIAGLEYECLYADVGSNGSVKDSGI